MKNVDLNKEEKSIQELLNFSIINMDKPAGPTSFQIDEFINKSLGLRKSSHAGTLDPAVGGVLPIMLNRACKLLDYFMHKNKTYMGIMRVHKEISRDKLEKEMENFLGKIMQLPPVKSRVKRVEREREVYFWKILEIEGKDVLFEVECEAGTYIRKLISDLGERIGGAHMLELRRTKAGVFSEQDKNFVNLYDFDKAVSELKEGNEESLRKILIPAEEAIKKVLPVIQVKENAVKSLLTGKPLFKQDIIGKLDVKEGRIAVFFGDRFIETAKIFQEGDIIAKPEFVYN